MPEGFREQLVKILGDSSYDLTRRGAHYSALMKDFDQRTDDQLKNLALEHETVRAAVMTAAIRAGAGAETIRQLERAGSPSHLGFDHTGVATLPLVQDHPQMYREFTRSVNLRVAIPKQPSPLLAAAERGDAQLVDQLWQSAGPGLPDNHRRALLEWGAIVAAKHGQLDVISVLAHAEGALLPSSSRVGKRAIDEAVERGTNAPLLKALVQRGFHSDDSTLLARAVGHGKPELVSALLQDPAIKGRRDALSWAKKKEATYRPDPAVLIDLNGNPFTRMIQELEGSLKERPSNSLKQSVQHWFRRNF